MVRANHGLLLYFGILGAGQLVGSKLTAADPMELARQRDYFGLFSAHQFGIEPDENTAAGY